MDTTTPRGTPRASPHTSGDEVPGDRVHLFVVERVLPGITERGLVMLQAALTEASTRFAARGEPVTYLRSVFMPAQERLLSLFSAASPELVRAANVASLVPFVSIQPAFDLSDPAESTAE